MKNFIVFIFVVIVIAVVAIWFYSGSNPHAEKARQDITGAASQTKQFVQDKIGTSNLTLDDIKNEMSKTGQVIREKAQKAGEAISDATADARITAAIKAKLVRDPDLSAIKISVSTSDGVVTLSGSASSPENIRKAIQLALDTDGVHKVVSTLQVKS
ncbi:MAG TPA: BON domain-containing protein [Verrucomicrobiae bacterium]|nr:BON domain-containing protein [Verrucomicrobiae bacterium]